MKETVDIDATSIESELRELWQGLAEAGDRDNQAVMRACVLNFIIYCGNAGDAQEMSQILAEITSEHPSRVILVTPIPGNKDQLQVEVTARCHSVAGKRDHICCEIIHLSASKKSLDRVASLIWTLLIPDLPTAVWWRSKPAPDSPFLQSLIDMADRVILDMEELDPYSSVFRQLSRLIERNMEQTAFSDLAWSRLTPWRRAMAGFSDVPAWKHHLTDVERIEICFQRSIEKASISIRALYLVSWLASRLGWKRMNRPAKAKSTEIILQKGNAVGQVAVLFKVEESIPSQAGITGVRLITGGDQPGIFDVLRTDEQRYLQSRVVIDEQEIGSRISHKSQQEESELVCRELEILGHDFVFEEAFRFMANCLLEAPRVSE